MVLWDFSHREKNLRRSSRNSPAWTYGRPAVTGFQRDHSESLATSILAAFADLVGLAMVADRFEKPVEDLEARCEIIPMVIEIWLFLGAVGFPAVPATASCWVALAPDFGKFIHTFPFNPNTKIT